MTVEQIRDQVEVLLLAPMLITQAFLKPMREQGGGRIIQISSMGGQIGTPTHSSYHAGKWGLEGFTESVSREVSDFDIHLTLVEPGATAPASPRHCTTPPKRPPTATTPPAGRGVTWRPPTTASSPATRPSSPPPSTTRPATRTRPCASFSVPTPTTPSTPHSPNVSPHLRPRRTLRHLSPSTVDSTYRHDKEP
ncbi:SDR family NAD(P)-dependent oxidoreductase [Streptomyces sp. NPDC096310]|uniref:SDR family NAD(P)-dependent oxidoreductase n=1 Tax=Streptomyces sp. NPDC096310 TaxID=3366082 RepID=UPI0037FB4117